MGFTNKWVCLSAKEVADHMEYLIHGQGVNEIYFYDDNSFVDLGHMRSILEEVKNRGLKARINFRGVRISDILKMDKGYLQLMVEAGVKALHMGVESGSQRMLDMFNKGIRIKDIREANRKIARYKEITAFYNWIVGVPSETPEDLKETARLLMELIRENPRCLVLQPNIFYPIAGSELMSLVHRHGYIQPEKLEDWVNVGFEKIRPQPWISRKNKNLIKMLHVTSLFIDDKLDLVIQKASIKNFFLRLIIGLYRPFAKIRFEYGITFCLFEYPLYQFLESRMRKNNPH